MSLVRTPLGVWVVAEDVSLSREVMTAGTLHLPKHLKELTFCSSWIPEGGVVVDAGACIGDQTVLYAQMVGAGGNVFAFEPQPQSFEALERNTENLVNVRPVQLGLSDHVGTAELSTVPNIGASFLGVDGQFPDAPDAKWPLTTVKLTTLNHWMRENVLGLDRVDFLHLDAEGHESQILKGAEWIIARFHPAMMIEITDAWLKRYGSSEADLLKQLDGYGYQVSRLSSNPAQYDALCVPVVRQPVDTPSPSMYPVASA